MDEVRYEIVRFAAQQKDVFPGQNVPLYRSNVSLKDRATAIWGWLPDIIVQSSQRDAGVDRCVLALPDGVTSGCQMVCFLNQKVGWMCGNATCANNSYLRVLWTFFIVSSFHGEWWVATSCVSSSLLHFAVHSGLEMFHYEKTTKSGILFWDLNKIQWFWMSRCKVSSYSNFSGWCHFSSLHWVPLRPFSCKHPIYQSTIIETRQIPWSVSIVHHGLVVTRTTLKWGTCLTNSKRDWYIAETKEPVGTIPAPQGVYVCAMFKGIMAASKNFHEIADSEQLRDLKQHVGAVLKVGTVGKFAFTQPPLHSMKRAGVCFNCEFFLQLLIIWRRRQHFKNAMPRTCWPWLNNVSNVQAQCSWEASKAMAIYPSYSCGVICERKCNGGVHKRGCYILILRVRENCVFCLNHMECFHLIAPMVSTR